MIVSMQYLCDFITVKYGNCHEIVLYFSTKRIPKLVEALWSLFITPVFEPKLYKCYSYYSAVCVVWTSESMILSASS